MHTFNLNLLEAKDLGQHNAIIELIPFLHPYFRKASRGHPEELNAPSKH
jgi:hypothetical protein